MTEVTWIGKSGDLVEGVVAVMLSRRHPTAIRIRPSVGDGGIDVQVPNGNGWDIYQIKRFATNLEPGQKTQIKKSFERMKKYTASKKRVVTSWNLITPLDPTKENEAWLAGIVAGTSYRCNWLGKIFVDGLAAEFPDVIEYYFGTGQQRVQETIRQVATAATLLQQAAKATEESPIRPPEVEAGLTDLFKILNKFDPHYIYGFSVTPNMPPPMDSAGLLIQYSKGEPGCYFTVSIHAKHPFVTDEPRPTISVLLGAAPGTFEAQAIEDFVHYGAPLRVSNNSVRRLGADLPGGLSMELSGGTLYVGPTAEASTLPDRLVRLQVLAPNSELIAETVVRQRPATYGINGQGMQCQQEDQGGAFALTIQMDRNSRAMTWTIDSHDMAGRPAAEVLPGLRVMTAFHPPNKVRLAPQYGLAEGGGDAIPDGVSLDHPPQLLKVVDAIAHIQEYTSDQLLVPAADEVSAVDLTDIVITSELLRGRSLCQYVESLSVNIPATEPDIEEGGPQDIATVIPMTLTLGGQEIDLGFRTISASQVDVHIDRPSGAEPRMTWTSSSGDRFRITYSPALGQSEP